MTTHDRDKVLAAAKKAGVGWAFDIGGIDDFLFAFYSIAHEAGRQAGMEECIELLRLNAGSCSEDSITRLILDSNVEAIRARGTSK